MSATASSAGAPVDPRLIPIKLVVCDVDGVLTDGGIIVDDEGKEAKKFSVYDGSAVWLLRRCGIETAIISGRAVRCVSHRARDLAIEHVIQGVADKVKAFKELCLKLDLDPKECVFIGDDVLDVPLLRLVGFGVAPANGRPEAKAVAAMVTGTAGGDGVVREVAEALLRAQGKWDALLREKYGI